MPGISDAIAKLNQRGQEAKDEEGQKGTSKAQEHIDTGETGESGKPKADYSAATHELGGVTKILREEGSEDHGKPSSGHVVQQGGGGAAIPG